MPLESSSYREPARPTARSPNGRRHSAARHSGGSAPGYQRLLKRDELMGDEA